MEVEKKPMQTDKNEFRNFAKFFLKYLNGSASSDEAFIRATCTYRKLFKKIPFQNSQRFFSEFNKSEFANQVQHI